MRKIFSILVVLMMVAGTFVSCSMPTNDTPTVSTVDIGVKDIKDIPNCDLSYLVFTDGKKAICTNEFAKLINTASDKQSVLDAQRYKVTVRDSALAGWDRHVYDVDGGWITDADWGPNGNYICIINNNYSDRYKSYVDVDLYGLKRIYLPAEHIHQ